jgi:hypothetical protein
MNKIRSIDIAKGISVIFIVFLNSLNYWLIIGDDVKYIVAYIVIFSEILGPMLFIFTYSFENIFILKKMMGSPPERIFRNQLLKKGIFFIILGLSYNLILNLFDELTLVLWGWNFLLFLGFAQFISYFAFKLIRWARLVIGLAILFLTPLLRELMYFNRENNIIFEFLYFFIVSPNPSFSLLPYASLCFFASIFSELIYQAEVLENIKAIAISIKSTLRYGLIFLLAGLALSLIDLNPLFITSSYDPLNYPFIDGTSILRNYNFQFIPNMPEFLLKGTSAYLLFIIGILIIIVGLSFHFSDILIIRNRILKGLQLYGEKSLTLIFIQYIFLPLFLFSLNIIIIFPLTILFIVFLGYLMHIWKRYADSKLSIEWFIEKGRTKKIHEENKINNSILRSD